jgi:hypothetical protein
MKERTLKIAVACIALLAVILVSNRLGLVQGQQKKAPGEGFAAVPGLKGGQDVFGPYDPVQNWPNPLSESLPNHDGAACGACMDSPQTKKAISTLPK